MTRYIVIAETIDLELEEFQSYLRERNISSRATNVIHAQPGGGEDVEYTSDNRLDLIEMLTEWWGDDVDSIVESIRES